MKKVLKVWASFSVIGFHAWPNAPSEVGYLSVEHRHNFKYCVGVEVTELNRQIEFHTLKAKAYSFIKAQYTKSIGLVEEDVARNFSNKSCEMLAVEMAEYLAVVYEKTPITVEVSEDGENGAVVELLSTDVKQS